ncbi:Lysophosphatidic acid receptor 6 [Collichthys lucidus]|uniref:Lysophosphatidic acid receptor 6 n=1 Tax=Collichthys lucidus TaxID=240159 RepID=A0A4U5V705_COLLU|nr:Lysophosphatidic acid receptor 6 [Collichthys lucidus]
MTDVPATAFSPLSNCTVDTSYRFTFYKVSYSVIFLLGLATNGVALRRLCQSPCTINSTAIYMISLSAADMFFVISLPLRIYYYHQKARASKTGESSWTAGAVYCHLTFTVKYISLYGSIFFLVCIAVDRYFACCAPTGFSTPQVACCTVAARHHEPCLLDPSSQRHRTIILLALGLVFGSFLLPTVLLLYSYWRVLSVLRQPRRRSRRQRHNRQHTLKVIYWVLGVFLLCFVPYHINLLGYTLTHVGLLPHCGLAKVTKAVHPVVLTLASSNCCLNPFIYYFSSSMGHKEVHGGGGSGSQ